MSKKGVSNFLPLTFKLCAFLLKILFVKTFFFFFFSKSYKRHLDYAVALVILYSEVLRSPGQ